MKTILQALKDEIHYKLSSGFFENRLLARGINSEDECTIELINSKSFRGAVADCLSSLVEAPNFSEGDVSFSLPDRNAITKRANSIYISLREFDKLIDKPMVYIGG